MTLGTVILASVWILQRIEWHFLLLMFVIFEIIQLVSYLTVFIVSRKSLVDQLKSKSFIKKSHYFLSAVKIYIFAISIGTTASSMVLLNSGVGAALNHQPSVRSNYGILYPSYFGYAANNPQRPEHKALFQSAEELGAIYSIPQTPPVPSSHVLASQPLLRINDNYLKEFTILDSGGKRIQVDPKTTSGVILLADSLASSEEELKNAYQSNGEQGFGFNSRDIKIYRIKDNQKLPVLTTNQTELTPKILEVYTVKNAGKNIVEEMTRANGTEYNGVVFPIKGSLAQTYERLKPALLADNNLAQFPSFIKASDVSVTLTRSIVGNFLNFFLTDGFAVFLFVGMMFATLSFYFKVEKRRIAIQRYQGISYIRSYWRLSIIFVVQYLGVLTYNLLTQDEFLLVTSGVSMYELFVIFFVIEIIITGILIYRLEKYNMLNTLKGE